MRRGEHANEGGLDVSQLPNSHDSTQTIQVSEGKTIRWATAKQSPSTESRLSTESRAVETGLEMLMSFQLLVFSGGILLDLPSIGNTLSSGVRSSC